MPVSTNPPPTRADTDPKAQQEDPSCSAATTTIHNAADATALSPCATFTGTIELSPSAANTITLDRLQTLQGNLLVDSANLLTTLSLPALTTINGYLFLQSLPALTSLSLPSLTTITTQLRLVDLPSLSALNLSSTLTHIPLLTIANTALPTLAGLSPTGPTAGLNITNNPSLAEQTLSFPLLTSTRATSIAPLAIARNGPGLALSLPALTAAQSISLANLSAASLPLLQDAYELILQGNAFASFSAPRLRTVGNGTRGVFMQDNQGLRDVSLPALVRTGGLTVRGNSRMERLSLPELQEAPQGVLLDGVFEKCVVFPISFSSFFSLTIEK